MENKQHVAWRTCIGTGEKKDKREMLRLVRRADGSVVVDLKGKERGRGANISQSLDAFDQAIKKKALNRALKLDKPLKADDLSKLRTDFETALTEKALRKGKKSVTMKISKQEFVKIQSEK